MHQLRKHTSKFTHAQRDNTALIKSEKSATKLGTDPTQFAYQQHTAGTIRTREQVRKHLSNRGLVIYCQKKNNVQT